MLQHNRAEIGSRLASGIDEEHTELQDLMESYKQLLDASSTKKASTKIRKQKRTQDLESAGSVAMENAETRFASIVFKTGSWINHNCFTV